MTKIISFKKSKQEILKKQEISSPKKIHLKKDGGENSASKQTIDKKNLATAEIGILVWLYCPNCKTLQYTEFQATQGRKHKCGADVIEIEVPLDLTAENTICLKNLSILEELQQQIKEKKEEAGVTNILSKVLEHCKKEELAMIEKLQKISKNKKCFSYSWKDKKKLPIADINPLGLYLSEFRFKPEIRFKIFGIDIDSND